MAKDRVCYTFGYSIGYILALICY